MIKNGFILFLTACIWGVAFVAQSVGMEYTGPITFNAVRFLMGAAVLFPFICYRERKMKEKVEFKSLVEKRRQRKLTLVGGICCGIAICFASLFQQFGIQHTTVGKAGFITTLYIIIVPIMGIFVRKTIRPVIWVGAVVAAFGLYLLCMKETMSFNYGDVLIFICAVLFSIHILVIDYFAPKTDGVKISCIQFLVSGVICSVGAFLFEEPSITALLLGWIPIVYAGVLSCGVAYTLQIIGQRGIDPTVASMILSMESVISVIAGWLILNQALTVREIVGCSIVFLAVILVQLPEKKVSIKEEKAEIL